VCDDPSPHDSSEDDEPEDDKQPWDDELLGAFERDSFGSEPDDAGDEDEDPDDTADLAPTPGERVLFALAQLYRLHRTGKLPVHPSAFDVEDLARIVGVGDDYEFATEDQLGQHFHFSDEVLSSDPSQLFPWRLRTIWEWAAEQELNALWAEGWE
jgi:hypothetical protein